MIARLRAAGCVFAEEEARLLAAAAAGPEDLEALVARRAAGLPLEHLVGWAELAGVRVAVGPGVFVPRQRTALLVREAAALLRPGAVVVDLCCGSGAVGAALAAARPGVRVHAADVDPVALGYARRNLAAAGGRVHLGDLDAPLPAALQGRVDALVAVTPYVPSDALALLPPEARLHEPRHALDGGADGLDLLRRVAAAAPRWLAPGGAVLVEVGTGQAGPAVAELHRHGLVPRIATATGPDATVVVGTRRSGPARPP